MFTRYNLWKRPNCPHHRSDIQNLNEHDRLILLIKPSATLLQGRHEQEHQASGATPPCAFTVASNQDRAAKPFPTSRLEQQSSDL